jgi:aldose 1-epimerase
LSWDDSQPELFEVFPFRHDLRYQARLDGGRLEVDLSVHARGEDVVPVAFGLHPYLAPTGAPRERWIIELPPMRRLALDDDQIPVGPGPALAGERFELASREFDDGFDSLIQPARFTVANGSRRIGLELLEGYPCAQVFAPLAGPYICFEPMTAPANALRSGVGMRLLAPGEHYRASFSLSVEDLFA